jgi:cell volume regulation protein A
MHGEAGSDLRLLPGEIGIILALSCALGSVCAAGWKLLVARIAEGNEHLAAIGLAAVLYAVSGLLHANGVISVFVFGFFLGNTSHKSVDEVRRFHSEVSFFLRTAFFVYLGILLFHTPKPVEAALFALALSLLLACARAAASRAISFLEPSMRKGRLFEAVSSRGLTSAVLSVVVFEELSAAGAAPAIDLPLLALFVVFFTNAISAFLVFRDRGKSADA